MLQHTGRWRWVALAAFASVAVAAIVVVLRLDDAGSCFSERRSLSDAEKIEAAADYARRGFHLNFRVERGDGTGAEIMVRTPVYASAEEFMAANPGCCHMAGPGNPAELRHPEWLDKRRHRRPERSVVVVDMAVPFTGPDGERRTAAFRTNIGVKPCGDVEPRQLFERVARLIERVGLG